MTKRYSMVIVGGGSTWTPGLLKALCKRQATFPLRRLVMYDVDAGRQAVIGEFARLLFSEEYPQVDFSYTTDVEEAFREVDFVFCQMRTGGYAMREKDEKIPLSLGVIGQETCGPGGFAYGMRSIGDMIELVQNVRARSPDAWILNYTNPAAIVADALRVKFPHDRRILNICDQPVNLLRSYARLLGRDADEFEPVYFGLNHFGWFTHLYDRQGTDLLPQLQEIILNQGFKPADAEQRDRSWLDTYAVVADMMRDFPDYLPNTYLQYYLYPEYKLSKLDPNYTRANEVMAGREKRVFETCRAAVQAGTTKDASVVHNDAHGDMIVEVAESIAGNQRRIFVVIVENNGLINNLDDSAMVEVAATLGINGPRPFGVGPIPTFYKGMIEQQFAYERLTVEAWFEGSYHKALQALTLNRLVVDAKKARQVLDALIEANKGYWPQLK
ncbi:6-phospho-alpha-glucosidase [Brenneria corticis]|uniref:6-phospho-alpha-glucosidase n=1 Tax=Brenneria corticis TaxID=2173106 RepID=A0A2U1U3Y1_9GAMM|nr:6-phospho-alpha-glucosidase [Brenneria sp. CFCC 11842]PWC16361.1 6-phospho-alpha-glucosidase [Brenneria sp. CFCC 11842]